MTPTARTLKELRKSGCACDVVERWTPKAKIRKDFLGIIDVIAVSSNLVRGIQCTDGSNMSKRVKKLIEHKNSRAWLSNSATTLEVWGWRKLADGKWHARIKTVTLSELK